MKKKRTRLEEEEDTEDTEEWRYVVRETGQGSHG
jgi:hypothetical protein